MVEVPEPQSSESIGTVNSKHTDPQTRNTLSKYYNQSLILQIHPENSILSINHPKGMFQESRIVPRHKHNSTNIDAKSSRRLASPHRQDLVSITCQRRRQKEDKAEHIDALFEGHHSRPQQQQQRMNEAPLKNGWPRKFKEF